MFGTELKKVHFCELCFVVVVVGDVVVVVIGDEYSNSWRCSFFWPRSCLRDVSSKRSSPLHHERDNSCCCKQSGRVSIFFIKSCHKRESDVERTLYLKVYATVKYRVVVQDVF